MQLLTFEFLRYHYVLRKYSFTVRIVNLWNSLPENVISVNTVNTFKNRLDKFWSNQELVYEYKADLTGIRNRSLISLDDTYCIIIMCTYLFPVLGTTHI